MGMVLPVTATTFIRQGPVFADRITALAEADDRVFRALLRASKYGGYLGLVQIASTISVAVMVDLGSMPRNHFIAARVVGAEIESVYGPQYQQQQSANGQSAGGAAAVPSSWGSPAAASS